MLIVAAAAVTTGCASGGDVVTFRYTPPARAVATVERSRPVEHPGKVALGVVTGRGEDPNAAGVVRDALATELGVRGYELGADGPRIHVKVVTFEGRFRKGFASSRADGQVELAVAVIGADGATLHTSKLKSKVTRKPVFSRDASANAAIGDAMTAVFDNLFADEAFVRALAQG